MPIDGQAQAPDAGDDLIAFLEADDGNADAPIEPIDDEGPEDSDNPDAETEEDEPAEEDGDEPESDDAKPASSLKFKVPVKGEDGAETTIEVDEKELVAGYQRHSDYTRKTQDLARQRDEVQTVAMQKIEEGRNQFLQESQRVRSGILRLAQIPNDQELYALAQRDPAAAQAEQMRINVVRGELQQLEAAEKQVQEQQKQSAAEADQRAISACWGSLGQAGFDKPKLQALFDDVHKEFGIEQHRFETVRDPKLILMMRDAVEFKKLKARAGAVTKKVDAAPRLPAQRQSAAPQERTNKHLEQKFRSGNAGLRDLARFV